VIGKRQLDIAFSKDIHDNEYDSLSGIPIRVRSGSDAEKMTIEHNAQMIVMAIPYMASKGPGPVSDEVGTGSGDV